MRMSNKAAGKQVAARALTPKLRFPEFRDAGSWEEMALREICLRITNGKANAEDHEEDGIYPLFDRSAVIKRSSAFMFDAEAVILPGEGMRFIPKYFKGRFNLHQRAYALMEHQGDARFVYYSLDYRKDLLAKKAVKSTVLSLRLPIVENFVIGRPQLPEQQKVAECLTSLDEVIATQSQKLAALKTHKKGLMQQLFPREGESQPRLRFPEFQEQWGETPLGNLCDSISSGRDQSEPNGAFDLYGSTAIIGKTTNPSFSGQRILVARVGANAGLLTKADGQYGVTDNTLVVSPSPSVNIDYLFYYLGNININRLIFGSGQPLITGSILKNLRILLPVDSEQRKISACLASLDECIIAQSDKLEALKIHKRGLMQQLFPSPEAGEA